MLDPIQMGLRIIRLGCSRFTIEHRSYQFVRLQDTNMIQIFLFVLTIEHRRHQFARLLSTVEHWPAQAQFSERDYARAARPRLLAESLAGLRMSTLCSYILNVILLCGPSAQSITHHTHKPLYNKRLQVRISPFCIITWLPYGVIYVFFLSLKIRFN